MVVDMMGGVFCTLSLAFRSEVDIIGTVSRALTAGTSRTDVLTEPYLSEQMNYSCVVVLDLGVLILAMILNPRARRKRSQAGLPMADPTGTEQRHQVLSSLEDTIHDDTLAPSPFIKNEST